MTAPTYKFKGNANQTIVTQQGNSYTADANGIFIGVTGNDLVSMIEAGAEFLPGIAVRNNVTAVADPTSAADGTLNYGVGSIWVNTSTGSCFMNVDPTTSAAVWTSLGSATISNATVTSTPQLDRASSTTLTNIGGLVQTVVAGTYAYSIKLGVVSTANTGIKIAFKLTTTVLSSIMNIGLGVTASGIASAITTTATDQALLFDTAAGVENLIQLDGSFVVGTGGTMQLQMGQHTSHTDTTSVLAGSTMTFKRTA